MKLKMKPICNTKTLFAHINKWITYFSQLVKSNIKIGGYVFSKYIPQLFTIVK